MVHVSQSAVLEPPRRVRFSGVVFDLSFCPTWHVTLLHVSLRQRATNQISLIDNGSLYSSYTPNIPLNFHSYLRMVGKNVYRLRKMRKWSAASNVLCRLWKLYGHRSKSKVPLAALAALQKQYFLSKDCYSDSNLVRSIEILFIEEWFQKH